MKSRACNPTDICTIPLSSHQSKQHSLSLETEISFLFQSFALYADICVIHSDHLDSSSEISSERLEDSTFQIHILERKTLWRSNLRHLNLCARNGPVWCICSSLGHSMTTQAWNLCENKKQSQKLFQIFHYACNQLSPILHFRNLWTKQDFHALNCC